MALVIADRVLETSTTTGTGAFALVAAITGYQRFSAVCSVSDTVYYVIFAVDANGNPSGEWETGLGTYSSANTLTRTTVHASTNAGAAVNFGAGTKYVALSVTAEQAAGFGGYTDEQARDAIAAALVAGTGITITVDDGGDTITIEATGVAQTYSITLALSDLVTNLAVGAGKAYWDPPFPITISSVSASVFEAPTGAAVITDINEDGVSILSTKISVDATELRSIDSAAPPVISDANITGRLTFDIDQVGSTTAGKGLQVTIEYTET